MCAQRETHMSEQQQTKASVASSLVRSVPTPRRARRFWQHQYKPNQGMLIAAAAAAAAAALFVAPTPEAHAANQYMDLNGTAAGFGSFAGQTLDWNADATATP